MAASWGPAAGTAQVAASVPGTVRGPGGRPHTEDLPGLAVEVLDSPHWPPFLTAPCPPCSLCRQLQVSLSSLGTRQGQSPRAVAVHTALLTPRLPVPGRGACGSSPSCDCLSPCISACAPTASPPGQDARGSLSPPRGAESPSRGRRLSPPTPAAPQLSPSDLVPSFVASEVTGAHPVPSQRSREMSVPIDQRAHRPGAGRLSVRWASPGSRASLGAGPRAAAWGGSLWSLAGTGLSRGEEG